MEEEVEQPSPCRTTQNGIQKKGGPTMPPTTAGHFSVQGLLRGGGQGRGLLRLCGFFLWCPKWTIPFLC